MSTINIRTTEKEKELIQKYAGIHGKTVSSFIKDSILEMIEDEYDYQLALKASKEFDDDPIGFSADEIKKMYDL
jgi:uncharacterized protein (DUF1778 family)